MVMKLPVNIEQVIIQLELIVEESINRSEREGYFAALYLRVTKAVKQKIDEQFFEDNPRMAQLDVVFANRYLAAYHQYKSKVPCSASWQVAFDACQRRQPLVIQHLLIGMNAHIGLDLGIAAATICPGASVYNLHSDFNKINEVLAGLVNTVEQEIEKMWPLLKPIDWLAGNLDEKIAIFSMNIARDAAWQTALEYASKQPPAEKIKFIASRDAKVAAFGNGIAKPGFLLNTFISLLGIFELGKVKKKIKDLLI